MMEKTPQNEDKRVPMNELFKLDMGGENEGEIKQVRDKIRNTVITHSNFNQHVLNVQNTLKIISVQIENEYSGYLFDRVKFVEFYNSEGNQTALNQNLVTLEAFHAMSKLHDRSKQLFAWNRYAYDLLYIIAGKLTNALGESKAMDIKRDALKEMREMENKRNELLQDLVKSEMKFARDMIVEKQKQIDENFIVGLKEIERMNIADRRDILSMMTHFFTKLFNSMRQNGGAVRELKDEITNEMGKQQERADDYLSKNFKKMDLPEFPEPPEELPDAPPPPEKPVEQSNEEKKDPLVSKAMKSGRRGKFTPEDFANDPYKGKDDFMDDFEKEGK